MLKNQIDRRSSHHMELNSKKKIRVLIFIGSLRSGGKERRMIDLLTYLKNSDEFEFRVILTSNIIHYADFFKLDIPYHTLPKAWDRNDFTVFYQFYKVCMQYQPDIIHAWGRMQAFYTIPAVIKQDIILINSQITSAPPKSSVWSIHKLIDRINFKFSKVILSNSLAGIAAYNPPSLKSKVIYNGINFDRFLNLPDFELTKAKYGINTPFAVLMSASFSPNKDHERFLKIAKKITEVRDDITFIGVGAHDDSQEFKNLKKLSAGHPRILFPGRITDVEALIQACTIGVLFSNKSVHGEGISNSVMEYMMLSKPVIANDAGGTREIVHHNENGYLVDNHTEDEIAAMILDLINDRKKRESFGARSKEIIMDTFSLEKMGKAFELVYREAALT